MRDDPSSRDTFEFGLAMLASCEEKLNVFRLATAMDELERKHESLLACAYVDQAWSLIGRAKGIQLQNLVRSPWLSGCIADLTRLMMSGGEFRAESTLLRRTLAHMSSMTVHLSFLGGDQDCSGEALLLGGLDIPLSFDCLIRRRNPTADIISWERRDGLLVIRRHADGALLLEMGEEACSPLYIHGDWDLRRGERLRNARLFAEGACTTHLASLPKLNLTDVELGLSALSEIAQRIFGLMVSVVLPYCDRHRLITSSIINLRESSREEISFSLATNLTSIACQVYETNNQRQLSRDLGFSSVELLSRKVAGIFQKAHGLCDPNDYAFLHVMLNASLSQAGNLESASAQSDAPRTIDVSPSSVVLGSEYSYKEDWIERKVVRQARGEVVKWHIADALAKLDTEKAEKLMSTISCDADEETVLYSSACHEYNWGNFSGASVVLLQCLGADSTCENYWLLLAFCCRHLNRLDLFDRLIYQEGRTTTTKEIQEWLQP